MHKVLNLINLIIVYFSDYGLHSLPTNMAVVADLSKYLDPSSTSSPPTDVTFVFSDTTEIKAHKVILSFASEVFNREFFGSLPAEEKVEIKDASREVFLTMIEFIYNKQFIWKDFHLAFLSSLYYLAEKYDIRLLKNKIIDTIPEHEVTEENFHRIIDLAEYNKFHEHLSEALYDAAAGYVKKSYGRDSEKVLDLFVDNNEQHALKIFKVMGRLRRKGLACENCKKFPCIDGEGLSLRNLARGAKVIRTPLGAVYRAVNIVKVISAVWEDVFTGLTHEGEEVEFEPDPEYYVYYCLTVA